MIITVFYYYYYYYHYYYYQKFSTVYTVFLSHYSCTGKLDVSEVVVLLTLFAWRTFKQHDHIEPIIFQVPGLRRKQASDVSAGRCG
jgi:hypothetical protein